MKDEVANKLMEKALTYLNSAEAFVGENVPKYIEELLSFKIFEHGLDAVSGFIPLIISLILLNITRKDYKKQKDMDLAEGFKVGTFTLLTGTFVGLLALITVSDSKDSMIEAYKAYKAPRVYLVDYFKGQK